MDLQILWREIHSLRSTDCWWIGCGGEEEGGMKNDHQGLGLNSCCDLLK